MFGPALRDEEVLRIAVDARIGGSFSFVVRRQGEEIDHIGAYLEIDRPQRLAFTWGIARESEDGSRVRIDIVPLATGCQLTLIHELHPDWADYASRTEAGWTKMLEALADRLASFAPARLPLPRDAEVWPHAAARPGTKLTYCLATRKLDTGSWAS